MQKAAVEITIRKISQPGIEFLPLSRFFKKVKPRNPFKAFALLAESKVFDPADSSTWLGIDKFAWITLQRRQF